MPLSGSPWKPRPEVELLERAPITVQEVAEKLRSFLETSSRLPAKEAAAASHMEIKMQQLPEVLRRLEEDWVALSEQEEASKCFVQVQARLEVHLHPFFMGPNLARGLRKAAGELLLKFNQVLGCMPLTIADLTPAGSRHGAIVAESPYVHFLASFNSVGFAPKKDQWLVGRVAEIQHKGGLNLQVLGIIHAHAMKRVLPTTLSFKQGEPSTWCTEEHGALTEQHLLRFKVDKVSNPATGGSMSLLVSLGGSLQFAGEASQSQQASSSSASSSAAQGREGKVSEKKRKQEKEKDPHDKDDAVPEESSKKKRKQEKVQDLDSESDVAPEEVSEKKRKQGKAKDAHGNKDAAPEASLADIADSIFQAPANGLEAGTPPKAKTPSKENKRKIRLTN